MIAIRLNKQLKGYFGAVISAIAFGCMPFMTVGIYGCGVSTSMLLFLRALLPVPIFGAVALIKRADFRIGLKRAGQILLLSLLAAVVTSRLLFLSYIHLDTGIATAIHFSYPVFVMFGELLVFRRRLRLKTVICAVLCVAGVALFCSSGGRVTPLGIVLAASSAVAFASFILYLDKSQVLESMDPFVYFTVYCIFGAVMSLAVLLITGESALDMLSFAPKSWLEIVIFVLVVGFIAEAALQIGVNDLGGVSTAFISTLEPLTSIVIGALLLHENFGILTLIGAALIFAGVLLTIIRGKGEKA